MPYLPSLDPQINGLAGKCTAGAVLPGKAQVHGPGWTDCISGAGESLSNKVLVFLYLGRIQLVTLQNEATPG